MTRLVTYRPKSPALRKAGAAHTRALGAHMHRIPFAGEPVGTVCDTITQAAMARRRAILWACWKGQTAHGLPDDLSPWSVAVASGNDPGSLFKVTLSPPPQARGFSSVLVPVPAWQIAEEEPGITIDQETPESLPPPCPHTLNMLDRPAPVAALPAPKPKRKAAKRGKPKVVMIMVKGRVLPLRIPAFLS